MPGQTGGESPDEAARRLARRNLRTALWLGLLAFGFFALFFWSVIHRGSVN
jgi:hypothetical protein